MRQTTNTKQLPKGAVLRCCGNIPESAHLTSDGETIYHLRCNTCGNFASYYTKDGAITAWNRIINRSIGGHRRSNGKGKRRAYAI